MCSINSTCKGKVKYGGYCFKHREYYLLDDKGIIRMDRFTNKISDYLAKDIIKLICITNNLFTIEIKRKL